MAKLLQTLAPTGRRLVTPELASGELEAHPDAAWTEHVQPIPAAVELDALDQVLARVQAVIPAHSSALDGAAAPGIHQALPLTRRLASDPGVWRFLAVVHQPGFIRYRWDNQAWPSMRDRFWRAGVRPDSNTFSRLWWIAELTVVDGDYALTERALATQAVATGVFVRRFSHYPPAARACVEALEGHPSSVVEPVLRRFNAYLSTVVLESQTVDQLRTHLFELIDRAWDERA